MSRQKQNSKSRGFTIIEVMIVLAIAGLIMVIVFLAVPALQRSSRNTQRKTDASNALNAVNEYVTNNGGALPASAVAYVAPTWTVGAAGSAQSSTAIGYYTTGGSVSLHVGYLAPAAAAADTLTIYTGSTCTNATTLAAGNQRQLAALFGIETASGMSWQCIAS